MEVYQQMIKRELEARKNINAAYSMRAFSRDLGIASSNMSEIINGKRKLSTKKAKNLLSKLQWPAQKEELFITSVKSIKKKFAKKMSEPLKAVLHIVDQEEVFSHWYGLAVLSLLKLFPQGLSLSQLIDILKLDEIKVEQIIDSLLRLEMIASDREFFIRQSPDLWIGSSRSQTEWLKSFYLETFKRAERSLLEDDRELRDFSTNTMVIDSKKIPEAKKIISKFRQDLALLLEEDKSTLENNKSIYTLSIQLFPLIQPVIEITNRGE